jgi:hypothetical protein
MNVELIDGIGGLYHVKIAGTDFGCFDNTMSDDYTFYPKRNEQLTGDHYIAIGNALNELNNTTRAYVAVTRGLKNYDAGSTT